MVGAAKMLAQRGTGDNADYNAPLHHAIGHKSTYTEAIMVRIRPRRGKLHVFDVLVGARTTLLVVDAYVRHPIRARSH